MRFQRRFDFVLVVILSLIPVFCYAQCGVERWSVKTGTDADAGLVNLSSTTANTIATMRSWPAPNPIPANNRVSPYETTVWVLNATLVQYKLESDSDYHLVLTDASGNTMIAEIPSPSCVGSGSPFLSGIQNARSQFDAKYTATGSFQTANIPVQVTGVGMFDFLHGQTGVAPNGIELHPVLNILFNPSTDTTPPATSITAPANGSTVSSTVTISANASDNVGVTKMEIYIDNVLKTSNANATSLTYSWDTTQYSNASHSIISKAYDAAGNVGTSTTITVTVNNVAGPPALTASYNSTYKAPACGSGGKSCDSGTSLLNGRGTMAGGVESNQPNTINGSCADGTSGTYHSDESLDRLSIATNDGTAFAGGKTVTVTATVWCYSSADSLDFYYTSSIPVSGSPTWTLIKTQACTASGAATMTGSYSLPSTGTVHAIRGTFRYNGSASACGTNSGYDDHDDLLFGVSNSGGDTTPPTTSITAPANGATVTSTVSINASASDNVGVTKVEIYIDSILQSSQTASPYTYSWNTITYSNGSHTIYSKAYDAAGNVGTSSTISVTVSNTSGVVNGGFETGSLSSWTSTGTTSVLTSAKHTGSYGARVASTSPTNGDSSIAQTFTVPSGATKVSFWYSNTCPDTLTYDWATATLKDNTSGTTTTILAKTCAASATWTQVTANVTAGHSVTLTLISHDDNYAGDATYTYFDDVLTQ